MSDQVFNAEWLEERFRFDNVARNQKVEAAFLASIQDPGLKSIVDLGSGTGANFLYFFDKIDGDQKWFLIEKDERFIEPTFQRLEKFAAQKGYNSKREHDSIKIQTPSKIANVHLISDSFFALPKLVDLGNINVVMAAALFDILSIAQFESIAEIIFSNKIPLLGTMNYFGTSFEPQSENDNKYIDLYDLHMKRDQPFGRGMGNDVMPVMENYFLKKELRFVKGKSNWEIGTNAFRMQEILLNFMENAISELLQKEEQNEFLNKWLIEKRTFSKNEKLTIQVNHFDFFALPK